MFKIHLFESFWGWRQNLVSSEPADEMGVLDETVCVEKAIENYPFCRKSMVTVVLIVFIPKFVKAYSFSPQALVLLLGPKFSHFRLERLHFRKVVV